MIESPLLDRILAQKARQTKQEFILDLITRRFGDVREDLSEQIRSVGDESRLGDLHHFAAICADLEAFRLRIAVG